ncbi:MAG: molybdopterin-dependent oxidoreductase [Candidatus Rokubacteria bacterium]|nr:molybdopterin-dependent oxidoreductase [Candidatus Rokubacteria bacterium]
MKWSRREFLASSVAAGVTGAFGQDLLVPLEAQAQGPADRWQKAPCRFCGAGCGVLVGLRRGRVVAVKGDPECPVNRGLLCIKGYSLPKILYGSDRFTTPLLRKSDKFVPIGWDAALDLAAKKFKDALGAHGPASVAAYFSGQSTIFEGYAINKLMKGGLGLKPYRLTGPCRACTGWCPFPRRRRRRPAL